MFATLALIALVLGFGAACYLKSPTLASTWLGSVLFVAAYVVTGTQITSGGAYAWLSTLGLLIIFGGVLFGTLRELLRQRSEKKSAKAAAKS